MSSVVDRLLYEAKTILAMHPSIALPLGRRRGAGHGKVFDARTDIVIEGFPRSANQFAIAALRKSQDGELRIANRVHAPAHAIAAAKANLPVLILIREPEEAVLGWVIYKGNISIGQGLRAYRRFYGPLLPYRDRFVVATFEEVTTDFGGVIRRLNQRFGTDFAEFEHTETNVRQIFEAMEWYVTAHWPTGEVERVIGRPSTDRVAMKDDLRPMYRGPRLGRSRRKAERLYRVFTS